MKIVDIQGNRERIKKLAAQTTGQRVYPRTTLLTYGKSRSGKTELLATFPRPLILADSTESGWKTIESMDSSKFYEPSWTPKVIGIETLDDFLKIQSDVAGFIQQYGALTLGVDSLTFLGDLVLAEMEKRGMGRTKDGNEDPRALYTRYKNLLRAFRIALHNLDVNVVWCCLESGIDEKTKQAGPLINGQSKDLFPAACDVYLYQTKLATSKGVRFYSHTTQYGAFSAGGRFGAKLPPMIEDLTYRKLVHYLYEDGQRKDAAQNSAVAAPPVETGEPPGEGETEPSGPTEETRETESLQKRPSIPAPAPRVPQRTPVAAATRR